MKLDVIATLRGKVDRTSAVCIAALIVFPVLLLAINHSWVYGPAGWLDPWIYAGYQMHFASLWRDFPTAYYGARMPWTAVGWLVHRIAGVEPALFILALLLYYVSTLSLYYTIRMLFKNPVVGFIAACLLGTNSWFLWAIGWDYIDGPMIALILLTIATLVGIVQGKRWRSSGVLCGAAIAATIALFSPNLDLLPIYALMIVALNHTGMRRPLRAIALYCGIGFVACALAMCATNWALGGDFIFFRPQMAAAVSLLSLRGTMEPWSAWFWAAPWLLFPAFAYIASIVILVARTGTVYKELRDGEASPAVLDEAHLIVLSGACFASTSGFAVMEQLQLGMLHYTYHANELFPFAFLVIGGSIAVGMSKLRPASSFALGALAALFCLMPWVLGSSGYIHLPLPSNAGELHDQPNLFAGPIVEPLWMLAGAGLVAIVVFLRNRLTVLALVAFLSILSITTVERSSEISLPDDGQKRDWALTIYDLSSFLDKMSFDHPLPLWWDANDPKAAIFHSLSEMMYLRFPNLAPPPKVGPGDQVVFLTSEHDIARLEDSLPKDRFLSFAPKGQEHVQQGSVGIDVAVLDVTASNAHYKDTALALGELKQTQANASSAAVIESPAQPWSYAATLQIPQPLKRAHPSAVYIEVRLKVDRGTLGVGVTLADGSTFIDRKFFAQSLETHDVYLAIPSLKAAKQIVVCNGGAPGSSLGRVYSASIVYARN